jgi:hypothetical protein
MWLTVSGRRFDLSYHSPSEWGDAMKAALIYLGCSEEYAERVRLDYVSAARIEETAALR